MKSNNATRNPTARRCAPRFCDTSIQLDENSSKISLRLKWSKIFSVSRFATSYRRMSCGARRFAPGASRPALCPLPPAGHIACPLCFDEAKCVPFLKQILEVPKQHKISKNEKNAKSKPNCLSVYAFRFSLWSFQKSVPLLRISFFAVEFSKISAASRYPKRNVVSAYELWGAALRAALCPPTLIKILRCQRSITAAVQKY